MGDFSEFLRDNPILPAPMCGISDRATRETARAFGAGLAYTQMISIEGLVRRDDKAFRLLDIEGEEDPIGVQLFGSRPEAAAESARILEAMGVSVVDFNMGCPARKVVENDCGAALLKNPSLVGRIVSAVVRAVRIPFTVKMRWDWDDAGAAALEVSKVCESEGAAAVCLHARTREAQFSGRALWDRIARLKSSLRIPVIGNGDIQSGADAAAMRRETGCNAVMIGRGLLGNPWLVAECQAAWKGEPPGATSPPSFAERIETIRRHGHRMIEWKGERHGIREFRKHAAAYLKAIPSSRPIREAIMKAETAAELDSVLDSTLAGRLAAEPALPY